MSEHDTESEMEDDGQEEKNGNEAEQEIVKSLAIFMGETIINGSHFCQHIQELGCTISFYIYLVSKAR